MHADIPSLERGSPLIFGIGGNGRRGQRRRKVVRLAKKFTKVAGGKWRYEEATP